MVALAVFGLEARVLLQVVGSQVLQVSPIPPILVLNRILLFLFLLNRILLLEILLRVSWEPFALFENC
jgi:hypothetical protein